MFMCLFMLDVHLPTKEVYYVHFTCVYFTFLFYITFIKTSKYS